MMQLEAEGADEALCLQAVKGLVQVAMKLWKIEEENGRPMCISSEGAGDVTGKDGKKSPLVPLVSKDVVVGVYGQLGDEPEEGEKEGEDEDNEGDGEGAEGASEGDEQDSGDEMMSEDEEEGTEGEEGAEAGILQDDDNAEVLIQHQVRYSLF
jgi:hypothetical protein